MHPEGRFAWSVNAGRDNRQLGKTSCRGACVPTLHHTNCLAEAVHRSALQ